MLEPATIHSDGCIASGQLSITRTAWIVDRWVFVLAVLFRDSHGPAQTLVLRAMVEDKVNKYSKTHNELSIGLIFTIYYVWQTSKCIYKKQG